MLLLHTSTAYTKRTLYWSSAVMCCVVSKEPLACHPVPRNTALWKKSIRVYQSTSASIQGWEGRLYYYLEILHIEFTKWLFEKHRHVRKEMLLHVWQDVFEWNAASCKEKCAQKVRIHAYLWHPLCPKNCCDSSPRYLVCKNCMCILYKYTYAPKTYLNNQNMKKQK